MLNLIEFQKRSQRSCDQLMASLGSHNPFVAREKYGKHHLFLSTGEKNQ